MVRFDINDMAFINGMYFGFVWGCGIMMPFVVELYRCQFDIVAGEIVNQKEGFILCISMF